MDNERKKNTEISEELFESLKKAYRFEKESAAEPCPMPETAIGYTVGELDAVERQKFRDHLHTCNSCLELVLDLYAAEIESQENAERSPKVLPALFEALAKKGNGSRSESKLNGFKNSLLGFFSPIMAPKYIGTAAVACLAIILINFGLNDPEVRRELNNINKPVTGKIEPPPKPAMPKSTPGGRTAPAGIDSEKTAGEPTGNIHQIEPLMGDQQAPAKKRMMMRRPRTPLERIALSQVKLVGIIISEKGNRALLEDASGKGYVVKEGTYIGLNSGKIVQINKDKVVIEEEIEDITGKISNRNIDLTLSKNP